MAVWSPVLCSSAGVAQRQLAVPSLVYRRELNRTASFRGTIPVDSADADSYYTQLAGGLPQLRLYQNGVLRFSGLWAPSSETSDTQAGTLQTEFRDPFDLLSHRYTGQDVEFVATDAGEIAWALIAATDQASYLQLGGIGPTTNRDQDYQRKEIAASITELGEKANGFDFFISPLDSSTAGGALGAFFVQAARGTDRSPYVILEHGPDTVGNTSTVARQTGYPINRAVVVGDTVTGIAEDVVSQGLYGVFETVESHSDIDEQAAVDAKATQLLQPGPIESITFEPEPSLAPVPFVDYDTGDTITVRARRNSMVIDTTTRVTAIEVELDDQGNEIAHRVEVGDARARKLTDTFRELKQRLATLEAT
jgi:hypothetical protein